MKLNKKFPFSLSFLNQNDKWRENKIGKLLVLLIYGKKREEKNKECDTDINTYKKSLNLLYYYINIRLLNHFFGEIQFFFESKSTKNLT